MANLSAPPGALSPAGEEAPKESASGGRPGPVGLAPVGEVLAVEDVHRFHGGADRTRDWFRRISRRWPPAISKATTFSTITLAAGHGAHVGAFVSGRLGGLGGHVDRRPARPPAC